MICRRGEESGGRLALEKQRAGWDLRNSHLTPPVCAAASNHYPPTHQPTRSPPLPHPLPAATSSPPPSSTTSWWTTSATAPSPPSPPWASSGSAWSRRRSGGAPGFCASHLSSGDRPDGPVSHAHGTWLRARTAANPKPYPVCGVISQLKRTSPLGEAGARCDAKQVGPSTSFVPAASALCERCAHCACCALQVILRDERGDEGRAHPLRLPL